MAKSILPKNIKDEVDMLGTQIDALDADVVVFDELATQLDRDLAELEAMESGIDRDLDEIERTGQEELVQDAVAEAEDLDREA